MPSSLPLPLSLSPRPAPPDEQTSSRTLHPIYQAIDTHNYAKALKLTSPSSSSSSSSAGWDVVRALRVHALERSGKRREALVLLWEILVSNVNVNVNANVDTGSGGDGNNEGKEKEEKAREVWSELYERIVTLTDATDLVNDANINAASISSGPIQLLDAVQRLDMRAYAPIPFPKGGITATAASTTVAAVATTGNKNKGSTKNNNSKSKGGKNKKSNQKGNSSSGSNGSAISLPPVTDETVLQTLCVTLRIEGLFDTMSEMYHQAMETLSNNSTGNSKVNIEEYGNVLEEAVCVHFKAVFDCSDVNVGTGIGLKLKLKQGEGDDDCGVDVGGDTSRVLHLQAQLPKLQTLLHVTKYYERMQTSSLQLAKLSAQPLHFQWTAISSLWYKESLQDLVATLERIQSLLNNDDEENTTAVANNADNGMLHLKQYLLKMTGLSDTEEIPSYVQKMKQKMTLLPRLAESLSSRMVLKVQQTVSENDWDVYLETLLVQGKKEEALEVLKKIQNAPMTTTTTTNDNSSGEDDGSTTNGNNKDDDNNALPQIDDEHTIENHIGSMLPYTQRKKLERLAQLSQELGMHKEAEGYYRELLHVFPDQWTYWLGLADASGDASEEGWGRCQSFANEVISTTETGQKHSLRGPHLMLLELAAIKVRQASSAGVNVEGKKELVSSLCDKICAYGNKFGPMASCCFADIRSYLSLLVQSSSSGTLAEVTDIANDVLHVLKWAKELWADNSQSNNDARGGSDGGEVSQDEFRDRRKKLRTYIFAVQVVCGIAAELSDLTLQLLQSHAPTTLQLVTEWRTSLAFLPGVAPKDGGQKEVLPGDEIILLTSQYLQLEAKMAPSSSSNNSANPYLLQAAGLLEEAIDHSPYNPHLKIAAIGLYSQLNAAHRALVIYEDLGVKQIQLDSCSYLILPTLIKGGLYTSAIKLSTSILRLHGSTSKEVKDYASRSLRNGLLFKAKEMATFQREKMRPSLQLLHSKGTLMDAAPLMLSSDLVYGTVGAAKPKGKLPPVELGMEKGFCGSEEDVARAEQLAIDAEMHFNAPAIIHHASQGTSINGFTSSDNRDMTVNYFESLHHNTHVTHKEMVAESLRRGHMHGLLSRAVMAVGAANAPKKGKTPKPTEETTYRCQSLQQSLARAKEFGESVDMDEIDRSLWGASCEMCDAIIVVIHGTTSGDSLAEREKATVSIIDSTMQLVKSARTAFSADQSSACSSSMGARSCQLLPDHIVPFYVLLETVARLFTLFGWGKRKRLTKAASGVLANLALSFRDLLSDMLQVMSQYRSFGDDDGNEMTMESLVDSAVSTELGTCAMQRVIKEIVLSRDMTKDRVDPFLAQMKESLETFDEQC